MKCVQIYKDGKMDELDLSFKSSKSKLSLKNITNYLLKKAKSQGNNDLKELYSWTYENKNIKCYGWYDGEAGFENKHDLPPSGLSNFLEEDSSEKLLFGDIFLLKIDENKIMDFVISDYGEFYNMIFGGMDNCDTETDEEDINTEEEDEDYIPNDDNITEDDYEILSCNEEDNLELDDNNY